MPNHFYRCLAHLLLSTSQAAVAIKVEINGRENEKRSFGLLLRYFPIGE